MRDEPRPPGQGFEIHVAGKPRTMRDTVAAARDAATVLWREGGVRIVDLRTGAEIEVAAPAPPR